MKACALILNRPAGPRLARKYTLVDETAPLMSGMLDILAIPDLRALLGYSRLFAILSALVWLRE